MSSDAFWQLEQQLKQLHLGAILDQYQAQTHTMVEIYRDHNVGRRYIKRNYKDVLKSLEAKHKIICEPPSSARRKNTLADSVKISFP